MLKEIIKERDIPSLPDIKDTVEFDDDIITY